MSAIIATGHGPMTLAASTDWVFVELHRENLVARVDPETNEQVEVLDVPVHCGLASSGPSVWATIHVDSLVSRFDQTTGEVLDSWELAACGLSVEGAHLWVTSPGTGELLELAEGEPAPLQTITVAPDIFGIAQTATSLWLTGEAEGGTVYRVERDSAEVTTTGQFRGADQILYSHDAIWVGSRLIGRVWKLNPVDGSVLAELAIASPNGFTEYNGSLWLTTYNDGLLVQVDPVSAEVVTTVALPYAFLGPPISAFGSLWTAALENSVLLRIDIED